MGFAQKTKLLNTRLRTAKSWVMRAALIGHPEVGMGRMLIGHTASTGVGSSHVYRGAVN